jgi:predicted nucleic acid-binding protein
VRPIALIDSGAIIALIDDSDRWHEDCRVAFSSLRLPLATSVAALVEVFHRFTRRPHRHAQVWRMVRSESIRVVAIDDKDWADIERLMLKYADRPMDFADATLVRLAEREGLTTILTVDRDFEVYRIGGRKALRVLPKR